MPIFCCTVGCNQYCFLKTIYTNDVCPTRYRLSKDDPYCVCGQWTYTIMAHVFVVVIYYYNFEIKTWT